MHKTTVYLNDEEIAALRQLASATGRSQAELIREAIRAAAAAAPPRRFRSLGQGEGPGGTVRRWNSDALYAKLFPDAASDSDPIAGADSAHR
jgi:hypothetical protein